MTAKLQLDQIGSRLKDHEPRDLEIGDARAAAVAVLLRQRLAADVEVLLIQRAHRAGDPWSGQMAFPGGMVEVSDPHPRATAERETREEVGIELANSTYLGRLDDLQGRHAGHPLGLIVSAYVYAIDPEVHTVPNHEVAQIVWTPLRDFLDSTRTVEVQHPRAPDQLFAGIALNGSGDQVVWGLTRRFIHSFFSLLNLELPAQRE